MHVDSGRSSSSRLRWPLQRRFKRCSVASRHDEASQVEAGAVTVGGLSGFFSITGDQMTLRIYMIALYLLCCRIPIILGPRMHALMRRSTREIGE